MYEVWKGSMIHELLTLWDEYLVWAKDNGTTVKSVFISTVDRATTEQPFHIPKKTSFAGFMEYLRKRGE